MRSHAGTDESANSRWVPRDDGAHTRGRRLNCCPACDHDRGKPIAASSAAHRDFEFYQCHECGYGWKVQRARD
jgi:DNA-directed RNA polymerase subunit M/transcription elongation factor TFIIS